MIWMLEGSQSLYNQISLAYRLTSHGSQPPIESVQTLLTGNNIFHTYSHEEMNALLWKATEKTGIWGDYKL